MTRWIDRARALRPRSRFAVTVILLALLLACGGAGTLMASAASISALGGPRASVDAGGLRLTLSIAPGPYFLRELLPVSVSLENHTRATAHVDGGASTGGCDGAFAVTQDGGDAPTYQLPAASFPYSCPGPLPTDLAPGALAHLVYMYTASAGGCGTGSFGWVPLRLPVVDAQPCAGRYGTWSYAIGAPGYAVASETLSAAQLGF
ncbi:MAG TPA: hypothetical protein VID73_12805 [Ktedonobacterales bacterium]